MCCELILQNCSCFAACGLCCLFCSS